METQAHNLLLALQLSQKVVGSSPPLCPPWSLSSGASQISRCSPIGRHETCSPRFRTLQWCCSRTPPNSAETHLQAGGTNGAGETRNVPEGSCGHKRNDPQESKQTHHARRTPFSHPCLAATGEYLVLAEENRPIGGLQGSGFNGCPVWKSPNLGVSSADADALAGKRHL